MQFPFSDDLVRLLEMTKKAFTVHAVGAKAGVDTC
jgi:hypothetical protein